MIEIGWTHTVFCPLRRDDCAGKECMAWRWFDEEPPEPFFINHVDPKAEVEPKVRPKNVPRSYEFYGCNPKSDSSTAFWSETDEGAEKRRRGYCGAFGKPEFAE